MLLGRAGDPNCLHIPSLTLEAGNTYTLVVSDGDDLDAVLPTSVVHSLEARGPAATLRPLLAMGVGQKWAESVLSAPVVIQVDVLICCWAVGRGRPLRSPSARQYELLWPSFPCMEWLFLRAGGPHATTERPPASAAGGPAGPGPGRGPRRRREHNKVIRARCAAGRCLGRRCRPAKACPGARSTTSVCSARPRWSAGIAGRARQGSCARARAPSRVQQARVGRSRRCAGWVWALPHMG